MTSYYQHHIKTLKGDVIHSWRNWPEWSDIQAEIAEWADCETDEVEEIETPGGDFLTVDGNPVAYVEHVAQTEARASLVPFHIAAE